VELHQQVRNLQAQLTESEDALDRERRRTQRIRAERDDLRREFGQMNQRIQQQEWSIVEHKKKIAEQARDIHEQKIQLDKQTKTIKVQSDTISGKQHIPDRGPFMTPARKTTQRDLSDDTPSASATAARRAHINDLPPPLFSLGRPQPKASYGLPLRSQGNSLSQALVPFGQPASSRPHHETSSVIASHQNTTSPGIDYMGSLQYIFSLAESWTRNYANIPNVSRDSKLSTSFLETLARLSGSRTPLDLLGDTRTRHFVIAAFINRCLVKKAFDTGALNGFDLDADNKLRVAWRQSSDTSK